MNRSPRRSPSSFAANWTREASRPDRSPTCSPLVSIPLRYMHSPVELVQLDDVSASAALIAATALRLNARTSFAR